MDNQITSNFVKQTNQICFTNATNTNQPKISNMPNDSFVSKHKKEIATVSVIGSLALIVTTALAYTRGKAINKFNNKESKLFSNITEGFKSFVGKGKEFYNSNVKKAGNNVDTPKIEPEKNTPNIKPVEEVTPKTPVGKAKVDKIIKDNSLSTHGIVGNVDNSIKHRFMELDDDMAEAFSEDVMKNVLTANGMGYYCDGINFNICNNLEKIKSVYTPEQVKKLCEENPSELIENLKKPAEEFLLLASK